jgi:uroporphyrinogen decarboxylase
MAYKAHAMISPAMTYQIIVPAYRRWIKRLRAAGTSVVEVDSDGYVGTLIPIWIDCGVDANVPMEVAAHNDIVAYRETYGTRMAYRGGVDKRCIAAGGRAMRDELTRVNPVIQAGGYIPCCDHGIPPDVSWPGFVEYSRLLAQLTGWL